MMPILQVLFYVKIVRQCHLAVTDNVGHVLFTCCRAKEIWKCLDLKKEVRKAKINCNSTFTNSFLI
jgi:hypothetical protein